MKTVEHVYTPFSFLVYYDDVTNSHILIVKELLGQIDYNALRPLR